MMIVLQLILFCALFPLMVKLAVRNDALNASYFYPKPVQERVYKLGLTDRETVARKRKRFMMFRLKKENQAFIEQTLAAIKGSDLVMYGTCAAFARHASEYLGIR